MRQNHRSKLAKLGIHIKDYLQIKINIIVQILSYLLLVALIIEIVHILPPI